MLVAPAPPEMYGMPYRSGTTLCACTSWDPYPPITAWTFCCAMSCSTSWALRDASEVSSRRERSIFSFFPPTSRPPASLTGGTDEVSASARAERTRERFQRMPVIEASNAARAAITDVRKREGTSVGPGGRGRAGPAGVPFAVRSEVEGLHLDRELVRGVARLEGHALPPDLEVRVMARNVIVESECHAALVLRHVHVGGERLLLVAGDRGDLERLQVDASLDLKRALLGECRGERVAAVDVLVLNRGLERADRNRKVEEHVGRGVTVVVLRVVGAADREDFLRSEIGAGVGHEVIDLGIEEVVLE